MTNLVIADVYNDNIFLEDFLNSIDETCFFIDEVLKDEDVSEDDIFEAMLEVVGEYFSENAYKYNNGLYIRSDEECEDFEYCVEAYHDFEEFNVYIDVEDVINELKERFL